MLKALKSKKITKLEPATTVWDLVTAISGKLERWDSQQDYISLLIGMQINMCMRHRKVTTKPKLRNAQDDTIKLKRACSMLCHKIGKRKWKKLRWWKNEEYQLWKSNA
jgi:hypothetical protein